MKRQIFALLLLSVICITLCSCGQSQSPAVPSSEPTVSALAQSEPSITAENTLQEKEAEPPESDASEPAEPEQAFPFVDDEGRTRYRLVINGDEVKTENLPFTYPDKPKGGYYPLKDVLSYFGVECLCSKDDAALTTKINDRTLKVTAGVKKMTYGPKIMEPVTAIPVLIDGCLYVPSVLFMSIFDDGIVGFSADRSAATLDTDTTINLAASGTAGLSIPGSGSSTGGMSGGSPGSSSCDACGGTGRNICTSCAGTGRKTEYQQAYDPISKQMKVTQKTVFCSNCGGRGSVTCPACGGAGHR